MLACGRWRKLLNIIDGLPSASHFIEAWADDDDVAEIVLAQKREDVPVPPRLSQFDPVVAELAVISDRLASLIGVMASSDVSIPPRPRPVTALERAKERRRWREHEQLVTRLIRNEPTD